MAFTYLLGWKDHDKWYYGVRYAEWATEESLGTTYFSSSVYVHKFIKDNGPPDIIKVLKVSSPKVAKSREERALRRLGVVKSDRWLNKANVNAFKGIVMDDAVKSSISKRRMGQDLGAKFFNNGEKLIRIRPGEVVPEGFQEGYILSEKAKKHVEALNSPENDHIRVKAGISRRGKYLGVKKPEGFGENLSNKLTGIKRPYNLGDNNPARREESRKKISDSKKGCKHFTDGKRLIFVKPGSEPDGFRVTNMTEWKCISSKIQNMKS